MNLFDASILAKQLISDYVPMYTFKWNNYKNTFGLCDYRTKTIFISRPLTQLCDDETVRNTIMHEIAHAMHPRAGHGRAWQMQMIRFGLEPSRLCNAEIDKSSIANWEAKCSYCTRVVHMIRKPRVKRSCKNCSNGVYTEKFRLNFYSI